MPMKGLDHRPWDIQARPGQTREWTMRSLIERTMNEIESKTKIPYKELVAKRLVVEAVNGNVSAYREIRDTLDGKPGQQIDITTQGQQINKALDEHQLAGKLLELFTGAKPGRDSGTPELTDGSGTPGSTT